MIKAVLFDLDGTLLDIDMDIFLKYYFQAMAGKAKKQDFGNPVHLIEQLNRSTEHMIHDCSPENTNHESFMKDFLANWPYPEEACTAFFDDFYVTEFPGLKEHCNAFPGLREMMTALFDRNLKIVIATQSVFPIAAIQQRLDWAGIGDFPYTLVTSYEHMHYCKPYVHYFQEIAERIGVEPANCLMVGNDTGEDLPASKLGMKTFLLEDRLIDKGNSPYKPDWKGKLPDLFAFLKNGLTQA